MNKVDGKTFNISPTCQIFTGRGKGEDELWCGEEATHFCSNALLCQSITFLHEKACCEEHFKTFYSDPKYNGYLLKKVETTGKWVEVEADITELREPSKSEIKLWAEGVEETGNIEEIEASA
jgi:hypothetical protein